MKLQDKHIIYFLGIGGIGMSALARWFMYLGKEVYGYDKTATSLTDKLESEGAIIHFDDSLNSIPAKILENQEQSLVVITPAVPNDHTGYNFLAEKGFPILKRSEVLGLITNDWYSVAVAGTHGKTTTSSMIAHILKSAGKSSISLMGGILQGYESNLIIEGDPNKDTIAVLEADEYDRSFLRLSPDIAVVTSADADHLDIYGEHDEMKSSFSQFAQKVKQDGHLYIHDNLISWLGRDDDKVTSHSYAIDAGKNKAINVHVSGSDFIFNFEGELASIQDIKLPVPGFHNVENAVAAIAVALKLNIDSQSIKSALATFKGVKRRFEYQVKTDKQVYIDDYAHHPKEISALLMSVKELYPGKKITVIFQPHLFTRTRDFADGFAESLDMADEVILLNIYPARELPMEGVTSSIITDRMRNKSALRVEDDHVLEVVQSLDTEVLLTVGAGNIDRFIDPIRKIMEVKA